ncbi:PadR family transcriptional regulator [Empedobacter falsenii]
MKDVQFYKGTLQPIILKLLQDHKRMYGYEIIQKIRILTQDEFELKEGALYPILHKLEAERVEGRIRKYYKLTEFGTKESVKRIQLLTETMLQIQKLLNPKLI